MGSTQRRRIEERIARALLLALFMIALALLQVTFPRPFGVVPNVILMLVICRALVIDVPDAALWAFFGGLAIDLCADQPLGLHATALVVAVLAAALPLARLSRDNWLLPLGGALFGTLAYHTIMYGLTAAVRAPVAPVDYVLVAVLPDLLLTLIPILPLFLVTRWLYSRRRGEVSFDMY